MEIKIFQLIDLHEGEAGSIVRSTIIGDLSLFRYHSFYKYTPHIQLTEAIYIYKYVYIIFIK